MADRLGNVTKHLLLLTALVLLIRLPFVKQAVAGDDVYYLAAAYHGLIDPWHPNHTTYVFEGRDVNFQGYPHPPGNAWFLTALLAVLKDVREVPLHAAYIVFSLIAVYGMHAVARRFSARPLWATALFAVVPAFFVNGNSFEADVPLLAFWMAGAAAFVYGVDRNRVSLLLLSALCLAASAMIAMQSFLFTPILLAYLWSRRDRRATAILTACTPILTLVAWQCFERISSGRFPAQVSAGYMSSYGYQRIAMKLRSALALSIHFCFLLFPALLPFLARAAWRDRKERDTQFLIAWTGIFLLGAWALFFAGSARYLLPLAAPLAILASRAPLLWIRIGVAAQLAISLTLAIVNYQHWDAYRTFAASLHPHMQNEAQNRRVWVDGEWGLRHYLEADGALPLHREQWIPTGDIVVENELAGPAPYGHGGRSLVPIAEAEIHPWLPLRIIGLDAHSGFSTAGEGLLPYDFRGGTIDRIHAFVLRPHEPTLSMLPMNAPEAGMQISYGIYPAAGNPWSWMSGEAELQLKSPARPATLEVKLYIADAAPARTVTVSVLNGPSLVRTFPGPGTYSISLPVDATHLSPVTVKISVDRTFSTAADDRKLGIILQEVGFE